MTWPSSAAIADQCTVYLPGTRPGKVTVIDWLALAVLSTGIEISFPSRTSFNNASCAASLKLSVRTLGAWVSTPLSAGMELCNFACERHGPAARAPARANAKYALLNIAGNIRRLPRVPDEFIVRE